MTNLSSITDATDVSPRDLAWIRASRNEYLFLRDMARQASLQNQWELALEFYATAGAFASLFHPGFFCDSVAENEVFRIGREQTDATSVKAVDVLEPPSGNAFSLLHVLSEVTTVGGHTSTLVNWIRSDRQSQHKIVVTRQRDFAALNWLRQKLEPFAVELISLDIHLPLLYRASQLRRIVNSGFDAALVQAWGSDLVPILAFATDSTPPIAYIDHSDHLFWMGSSVADLVIHQRPIGAEICEQRRASKACHVLPIPLETSCNRVSRETARKSIGATNHDVVALTIGRQLKYRPTPERNFFRAAQALTDRHANLTVHVVGVTKEQAKIWAPGLRVEQFRFHGQVPVNPSLLLSADVYLEGYPFGSQTALLEAALAGIAPVRAPRCGTTLLATSDSAVDPLLEVPKSEEQYIQFASNLIADCRLRHSIARRIKRSVTSVHTADGWQASLSELYLRLQHTRHSPSPIRLLPIHEDCVSVALHRWNRWSEVGAVTDRELKLVAKAFVNNVMQTQIRRCEYRLLPTIAVRSLALGRGDRTIVQMGIHALIRETVRRFCHLFSQWRNNGPPNTPPVPIVDTHG